MAEQRKAASGGRVAGFVESLVKDPKSPPRTTLLTGYLGAAAEADRTRIYFDPELNEAVDVLKSDVLHVEDPDDSSPLAQSYVWVRAGADLKPVQAEATVAASYLTGRISEENLAATQAYWAAAPGAGATPAMFHASVFIPHCPTRFPPFCPTVPWLCPTLPRLCFTRPWLCRTLNVVCRSVLFPCPTLLHYRCPSVIQICPTLQPWKCQSIVFCQPTVQACPTLSLQGCGGVSAAVICPTLAACPSAVDGCPSAPGGCWGDPTIGFDPALGGGVGGGLTGGPGGMNMWG